MGSDIMMVDGDVVATGSGDNALVSGPDELIQTAVHNVTLIYGELLDEPERGNMAYKRRIKLVDDGLGIIESDSKNAILYDTRVSDVPYIKATRSTDTPYDCSREFRIVDGDGNVYSSSATISLTGGE